MRHKNTQVNDKIYRDKNELIKDLHYVVKELGLRKESKC